MNSQGPFWFGGFMTLLAAYLGYRQSRLNSNDTKSSSWLTAQGLFEERLMKDGGFLRDRIATLEKELKEESRLRIIAETELKIEKEKNKVADQKQQLVSERYMDAAETIDKLLDVKEASNEDYDAGI